MSTRETLRPIRGNVYGSQGQGQALDVPRTSVYRVAALSVANSTLQKIVWDTREYDTDGMWRTGGPSAFFATTAGLYSFNAWVNWSFNATGFRQLVLIKNNTTVYSLSDINANAAVATSQGGSIHAPMNAGDYMEVACVQNVGAPLALVVSTATDRQSGFQACLISTIN